MSDTTALLLHWYDKEKRRLPWRAEGDTQPNPYHVWMSEIMLQQTTVATVKGYFDKFLTLWPTVDDLASAKQEDVLAAWAGLGYYARARNLYKCAGVVSGDLGGTFPDTYEGLKALPGIGDYTAAAIAAIAFGRSDAPVVDGNVERFITRLNRIETELPQAKKEIKQVTKTLTPTKRPGDFAQAMMDLGATICTPKNPKCLLCPVHKNCHAHKAGDAETYPRKAPKKKKPTRRSLAFAAIHDGAIYLERRPNSGLLGGMLGLPHTPWTEREDMPRLDQSTDHLPAAGSWRQLPEISKHTFTHFYLETIVYKSYLNHKINTEHGEWVNLSDLKSAGLPTVFKKMTDLI